MRRILLVLVAGAVLASAAPAAAAPPPGAVISENLEYLGRVPDTEQTVDGNFDRVSGRDVMITTGRYGLRAYDVSDPGRPRLLDRFLPVDILGAYGYWENEDVDLDTRRKLIIASLDPRHDDIEQDKCPGIGTASLKTRNPECDAGFYVISYRDPANLRQVGDFVELPAGHTSSCIQDCRWVWTGGPAKRDDMTDPAIWTAFTPGGRGDGRPVWVTDLRRPRRPVVQPRPIDLYRNDGATDYSHDVQVDAEGIAWTSGRGGVLGYATRGVHRDPRTDAERRATPADPVLVAGGGVEGTANPVMFMHNSLRPVGDRVRAEGVAPDDVLIGTEEQFADACEATGRVVFSDLGGSWGGEGAAGSTPEAPYRMRALDSFHPTTDEPSTTKPGTTSCSAHYFDLAGTVLATTWYGQGTRLLDVSDAREVRQVGYFRVDGTDDANPSSTAFSVKYRHGLFYVFDIARGVEVLRLTGGIGSAARMAEVAAPPQAARAARYAPRTVRTVRSGAAGGLVCPLFEAS